jgi:hypothetical protein
LAIGRPKWVQWTVTLLSWAAWQLFVLLFTLLVYANLFGEYGLYHQPVLEVVAGVVFLAFAVTAGTAIPVRRWRRGQRSRIEELDVDSGPRGA